MNKAFGQGYLLCQHHRPVADCGGAVPACLQAEGLDQLRSGGAVGLDDTGGNWGSRGRSQSPIVAISGDYDFQFMIEELAVGAQFKVPYIHVLVNNAYLGLIRQSQRGFNMDYCVQLSFENINTPELGGYGVDHVKVVEGLGCKCHQGHQTGRYLPAFEKAKKLMKEFQVPIVVEIILERVTNVAMGTDIDKVNEFEEVLDLPADQPQTVLV